MRNKKVRAWDRVTKSYLYSDKFPSMWLFYKELENRGIRHWETEDYIGLKDKNGKEMWEGDIALCPVLADYKKGTMVQEKGVVKWDNSDACFAVFSEAMADGYMLDNACNMEVIGNIHENPELLKEAK